MDDQTLAALAAEIERQDAALDVARQAIDALDDGVSLAIAQADLDELDRLTTPPTPAGTTPLGVLRA